MFNETEPTCSIDQFSEHPQSQTRLKMIMDDGLSLDIEAKGDPLTGIHSERTRFFTPGSFCRLDSTRNTPALRLALRIAHR